MEKLPLKQRSKSNDYLSPRDDDGDYDSDARLKLRGNMTVSGAAGETLKREVQQQLRIAKRQQDAEDNQGFDLYGALMWIASIILFCFLFRALSNMDEAASNGVDDGLDDS